MEGSKDFVVARCFPLILIAGLLSACGGGGGNSIAASSGTPAAPPAPSLTVSTNSVSASADAGTSSSPTASFQITVANAPSSGVTVGASNTSNGISTVTLQQTSQTQGTMLIRLKDPSILGPGVYADTVQVGLCSDDNCNGIQPGTLSSVSVNYTVTGTRPPQATVTPSKTNVVAHALPFANISPNETVTLTFQNINPINVSASPTFSTRGLANVTAFYNGVTGFDVTIYFKPATSLSIGTYEDTISLAICANPGCPTPISGSPITISTLYSVSPTVSGSNGYTVRVLNASAADIVSDLAGGKLYISSPSSATSNTNSIVPLDPVTGNFGTAVFAGSDPSVLATSDDGAFLYAGFKGTNVVKRFALPSLSQSLSIPLGSNFSGLLFANDIQVAPSTSGTVAIARINQNGYSNDVVIFDDAVRRSAAVTPNGPGINSLQWGLNSSVLYGVDGQSSSGAFASMSVNAGGVTLQSSEALNSFNVGRIHYREGLLYTDGGYVVTTQPLTQQGRFVPGGNGFARASIPYPEAGRFFMLVNDPLNGWYIQSFDIDTFTPIARVNLQGIAFGNFYQPRLVRWGSDGIATFTYDASSESSNKVILINGPFVKP